MKGQQFNIEKLREGCGELDIELSQEQCIQMVNHLELLSKWNKKLNLTAITDMEQMIIQHLLDSLASHRYLQGNRILDIGSGGGFPGLPMAILHPEWQITLLDSRGKRIEFLRNVCLKLRLTNVSLENSRIEHYRPGQKFDTLTARAFSSLSDIVEKTDGLRCSPCRLVALKGKQPDEEIEALSSTFRKQVKVEKIKVPFLEAQRHLILIDF